MSARASCLFKEWLTLQQSQYMGALALSVSLSLRRVTFGSHAFNSWKSRQLAALVSLELALEPGLELYA